VRALAEFLTHYWGAWLLLFFVAIAVWAYMPKRRPSLEEHGHIPLRDE
jgi:cbb3-type cytochrome oxidase subunit 3